MLVPDRFGAIKDVLAKYFFSEVEGRSNGVKACSKTCTFLNTLLHLLAVRKTSDAQKISSADIASILPLLFSILTQSGIEEFRTTSELLFDTAAYLSDDLSDEYRAHLIRSELAKYPDDPRISYILGPGPMTDSWLGLVTTNQTGASTPAARLGARPATPQRASGTPSQPKNFNPPIPFPLRRWELLPDQGSNTTANDTAISLCLVGARKA